MKTVLINASNSKNSINGQLLNYVNKLITNTEVLDLTKYNIPIYNMDIETSDFPEDIITLAKVLKKYDSYIISSPEHNGYPTAFFKNILDWLSRHDPKFLGNNSSVFLMSTSPGAGGGANHLKQLQHTLSYFGGNVKTTYSLPSFYDNFKEGRIIDEQLNKELEQTIKNFIS